MTFDSRIVTPKVNRNKAQSASHLHFLLRYKSIKRSAMTDAYINIFIKKKKIKIKQQLRILLNNELKLFSRYNYIDASSLYTINEVEIICDK